GTASALISSCGATTIPTNRITPPVAADAASGAASNAATAAFLPNAGHRPVSAFMHTSLFCQSARVASRHSHAAPRESPRRTAALPHLAGRQWVDPLEPSFNGIFRDKPRAFFRCRPSLFNTVSEQE
ncbi:hypothetical protein GXB81_08775, partial [Paraburkholderia sp. Ac-20336]|nr:hypothetical protein [Paraburkholderia sp. Ac-20336]